MARLMPVLDAITGSVEDVTYRATLLIVAMEVRAHPPSAI